MVGHSVETLGLQETLVQGDSGVGHLGVGRGVDRPRRSRPGEEKSRV